MTFDTYGRAGDFAEPVRRLHPVVSRLREIRYQKGLSQTVLAKKLGYHVKTLKDWEAGKYMPKIDSVALWAESLGVTLEIKE